MTQAATELPPNAMRRSFTYYLAAGLGSGLLSLFSLAVLAGLSLGGVVTEFSAVTCPFVFGLLAGLAGLVLLGMAVWARGQEAVVDDLLKGTNRLGFWRYAVDENNRPRPGYAYIGRDGVYKDGFYYFFRGRSRHPLGAKFFEGAPPTLLFAYRVVSRPSSRSTGGSLDSRLVVPVPPGLEDEARRVVAEFNAGIQRAGA